MPRQLYFDPRNESSLQEAPVRRRQKNARSAAVDSLFARADVSAASLCQALVQPAGIAHGREIGILNGKVSCGGVPEDLV